jgi:uncharacterized repeat protein (TIGR03803 family)
VALGSRRVKMTKSSQQATWSAFFTLALVFGLGSSATYSAQARSFRILHNFTGSPDGQNSLAGLVWDGAGNLYGTTPNGGDPYCLCGTVFRTDTSGTESVVYSFTGKKDGAYPVGGLVRDNVGDLYGTTSAGGVLYGVVFKMNTGGSETVLHTFAGGTTDGCYPGEGSLLLDRDGSLYGTTSQCGTYGYGTIFKVDTSGTETVLYNFTGSDGAYPAGGLRNDRAGNLYGVTPDGGAYGQGTVFTLSMNGELTVLHSFAGGADGCYALGTPALDKNGNLYGTTEDCGPYYYGIVWKLDAKGTETLLHSFKGEPSDGGFPAAGVILDAKGNIYGDTANGGKSSWGAVYELEKGGALTLLHSFTGLDGEQPSGALTRDAKGNFYGTAQHGANLLKCQDGCGTVWKLTP